MIRVKYVEAHINFIFAIVLLLNAVSLIYSFEGAWLYVNAICLIVNLFNFYKSKSLQKQYQAKFKKELKEFLISIKYLTESELISNSFYEEYKKRYKNFDINYRSIFLYKSRLALFSNFPFCSEELKQNCIYYSSNSFVHCAVHPGKSCKDCKDFEVKKIKKCKFSFEAFLVELENLHL